MERPVKETPHYVLWHVKCTVNVTSVTLFYDVP